MIQNIRFSAIFQVLRSHANGKELKRSVLVINRTNFRFLLDGWSHLGELRCLKPGRRVLSGIYLFYHPQNERAVSCSKTWLLVRALCARLPVVHPIGWNFEVLGFFERDLDGDFCVGSGKQDQLIRWDDEFSVDFYKIMAYGHVGSPKDAQQNASTVLVLLLPVRLATLAVIQFLLMVICMHLCLGMAVLVSRILRPVSV